MTGAKGQTHVISGWLGEEVKRARKHAVGSLQSYTLQLRSYFQRALCSSSAIRTSWLRVLTPVFWKSC